MSGRLEDRVCVVTGGAGGIGQATIEAFSSQGARVVGVDLHGTSAGHRSISCDVTDEKEVMAMFNTIEQEYGHVDVLFNGAGISPTNDRSVMETDLETWDRVIKTNLYSIFLCCKHGVRLMTEKQTKCSRSIINVASFVASMGSAISQCGYTASKGGVVALTRELGVELATRGVRVNALCPGPIETPLLRDLYANDSAETQIRLAHIPMARFGTAEEVADAGLFLASDESSYITASSIFVDGGISNAYICPEQFGGGRMNSSN